MAMFQPLGRAMGTGGGPTYPTISYIVALGVGGELGKTSPGAYPVVVPPWAVQAEVYSWGASGGTGANRNSNGGGGISGPGAFASSIIPVTPGEALTAIVGGKGLAGNGPESGLPLNGAGGYNGGGNGGQNSTVYGAGGGGGGASELRRSAIRLVVAAGGGGAAAKGNVSYDTSGGKGGAPNGGNGNGALAGDYGLGATVSAPGAASAYGGSAGSGATGGNGYSINNTAGGGGGGGLFGGGGGGASSNISAAGDSGGGGGGSSLGAATASGASTTAPMETHQYYMAPAARGVLQIVGPAGVDGNDGRIVIVFRA